MQPTSVDGKARVVPSAAWPSLVAALESAQDGTHIEVLPDYRETLTEPLILDRAILIDGPADCSARFLGEEGIVIAGDARMNSVVLRRLEFHLGAAPALLVAGGCTLLNCSVQGADVGIEVTARTGRAVQILNCLVRGCRTGISFSGRAATELAGTRVEHCTDAVAITGLDVNEGWNEVFGTVEGVVFEKNEGANLTLRGWSICEKSGVVRLAPPGEEIAVRGWPREACNVVAPTDQGPVVLHFTGGQVNATLFEDDYEEGAGTDTPVTPNEADSFQMEVAPQESLLLQTNSEP
jgi:hypothetical protein